MRGRAWLLVAHRMFHEAVRHRLVVWPSILLGLSILVCGQSVFFGFGREAEMVREVAAATLAIGVAAIAVLAATGALEGETQRGAGLLLFVKPLHPAELLAGKLLGSIAAAAPAALAMCAATMAALVTRGDRVPIVPLLSVVALALLQGAILASASLALSTVVHRSAAALAAALLFVLGHVRPLLEPAASSPLLARAFRHLLLALVPNLAATDPTAAFGRGVTPAGATLLLAAIYALLFAALAVSAAAHVLARSEVARA
jgi:hypothetical protein